MVIDSVSRTVISDTDSGDRFIPGIIHFYEGRSVFITGASGFVGSVLLESLLRCCPDIENVYILIREKKDFSPEERKDQILRKGIFSKLLETNPKMLDKIRIVKGDVIQDELGIESKIMAELEEKISVVIHCAASVSFLRSFRQMVMSNVVGTYNVVKFCRRLPKLAAFVHCSTAYSNCNHMGRIEEKVYNLDIDAEEFMKAATMGDDVLLDELLSRCKPVWPNNYTSTKAIAESLISSEAKDLPVAIVRPSVITHSLKGALPGYAETGGGIFDVGIGIGKGFIRVLYLKKDVQLDIVPVDVVSNTLITASWYIGTRTVDSSLTISCTTSHASKMTWGELHQRLYELCQLHPLPKMYQKPCLVIRSHRITYWLSSLINHYAPAFIIDSALFLIGKKPILTPLYRFYDRMAGRLSYFVDNEWVFECNNLKMLTAAQSDRDAEIFPMEGCNFDGNEFTRSLLTGSSFFDWKMDKRSFHERMQLSRKRYMFTMFIKWLTVFVLFSVFVLLSKKMLSLFGF